MQPLQRILSLLTLLLLLPILLSFPFPHTPTIIPHKIISTLRRFPIINAVSTTPNAPPIETFASRFAPDEPRKGCDVLVEALEREGVAIVFAYPGVNSMEIHQALTRSQTIRNVLPRHSQGGIFAAEGYARATGFPGVFIATSGPGSTNLVSGLADAMFDSIPIVAITGQVPCSILGTNAFQETPIVEAIRPITKHNYLVMDVQDIPRIVREAFFLARSGRPGLVLIDIPKDVQQQMVIPNWDLYSSGQYFDGSWSVSNHDELSLQMLGMHGTVCSNYTVESSDLLLAFGVRLDNHVTGKLEAFASRAKIVHIVIDATEIGKNKKPYVSICADIKLALQCLNSILEREISKLNLDFSPWRKELTEQKLKYPLKYKFFDEAIPPQYAIQWEDGYYKAKRTHTYLGNPSSEAEIFPNMLKFAEACDIPAARVTNKNDVRAAIQKILDTPGPYLLDVIVPHQEHVLPMIPSDGAFKDVITEGDGRSSY
ncbi:hypothetical protein K7X08_032056 [Anisodus acutangulus]|uniref:Acetolactate synthase n=1 Tax=Anisodus acutangulus TaxID=402998 RepID=A0A9Q1MNC3_9SOLA|nr:hypothetical protein K7X08_032056 [Anisodus acutangulus]